MRALRTAVACLLGPTLLGCPGSRPPRSSVPRDGPPLAVTTPERLLSTVSTVNDGYSTLRSTHRVALTITPDRGRSERRVLQGVLAIRRPASFRLLILGPAGVKLAELLYNLGTVKRLHLARGLESSSRIPEILASIAGDIRDIYRLEPAPATDRRTVASTISPTNEAERLYILREFRDGRLVRQMDLNAATAAVVRTEVTASDGRRRTILYGDHIIRDGLQIARTIQLKNQGTIPYSLSIAVQSVDINEKFDPTLFEAE